MPLNFCDTHASWPKGGVENAIGRLRRFLPRSAARAALTEGLLRQWVRAYNNTPRKCLGYRTPAEVFTREVLRGNDGRGGGHDGKEGRG